MSTTEEEFDDDISISMRDGVLSTTDQVVVACGDIDEDRRRRRGAQWESKRDKVFGNCRPRPSTDKHRRSRGCRRRLWEMH